MSRGLRREALIVLAVATLLLAVLAVGTLASYRAAIHGLAEQRLTETRRSFARWARSAEADTTVRAADLQAQFSGLVDLEFRVRPATPALDEGLGVAAPARSTDELVVVTAPVGTGHFALATFDNSAMARQALRLRWLEPVVVGSALAATLVLLLFARRLLLPYERLEGEKLDESLRRLGEVSAGVAHEFRNGLATIQGYAQLALRAATTEQREDLQALAQEASHLERVVGDFLTFARPGSARTEEFDLTQLVERAMSDPALAMTARIEGLRGMSARSAPPSPLIILADRVLLDRALRNLLRNACEAQGRSEPGSSAGVEITIGVEADSAVVEIRDHGPGWPAALRARLGEPFVTDRPGGVGLGLALAHRIARLHGGDLRLLDTPGGGARVRLELPRDLVRGASVT